MNRDDFRRIRDAIALESMLARGRDLEVKVTDAWAEVTRLRKELKKHHVTQGLQYNLTKEQFDDRIRTINIIEKLAAELLTAQRAWAEADAQIGCIVNDSRYVEWAKGQAA